MVNNILKKYSKIGAIILSILFLIIMRFYNHVNILEIMVIIMASIIGFILYKYCFRKIELFNSKSTLIITALYVIINIITILVLNIDYIKSMDVNSLVLTINTISYLFTIGIIFQFNRRTHGNSSAIFSLLVSSMIIPMLFHIYKMDIRFSSISLIIFSLYLMVGFDHSSFTRKKNIARLIMELVTIFVASIISVYNVILVPIIAYDIVSNSIKEKNLHVFKKYIIASSLIMILFASLGIVISNIECVTTFINRNPINLYDTTINCYMLLFMLFSIAGEEDKKYNNTYILFIYLVFYVLNSILKMDYVLLIGLSPLLVIYFINTLKNFVKIHKSFVKYFVPKNIKKVSVVVPNYNYENYIGERIDSILNQTYPIYELIVLDDCSKDNSVKVIEEKLKEAKEKYPNVIFKFIPNKKNSGNVFKQWKKCFDVSTGDYLWIAEADDLSSKYFLNEVMRGFNNDKVILSYCESCAIDENGKKFKSDLRDWIDIYEMGKWDTKYVNDGKKELKESLCINNTIANVSSVVFKKVDNIDYSKHLKEATDFVLAGDWWFYYKVLLNGSIAYFTDSLNYHRMHSGSVTAVTDGIIEYKEIVKIQDAIMQDVKLSKEMKRVIQNRRDNLIGRFCISKDELYYDEISLEKLIKTNKIKDDVLLSIIIPVYNVEPYIEKCLKSIFKDLPIKTEVIIINDGSPDNSEEIILRYKEKYNQIRYIKKPNGGLSSVKNRGLKEAKGKYIIFLDSDDYVSCNMYSTMLKKAIDTNSDIVLCDVLMTYEDGSVRYCSMLNYDRKDFTMSILDGPLMPSSWSKMVKRELYDGLTFPEGKNNEDVAVSPIIISNSKKTTHIASPFYKYVQRSGSIQNSGFSDKRFVIFETTKLCLERAKKLSKNAYEKIEGAIIPHQILSLLIFSIDGIKDNDERINAIEKFCQLYNSLGVNNDNKYIKEYIKTYSLKRLMNYISSNDYKNISKEIKKINY